MMSLTNRTVDFWPSGSTMVWGPIPWQHSWQIVWVKKDSKSTSFCCSFSMQTVDIGWRICLNLIKICICDIRNISKMQLPKFDKWELLEIKPRSWKNYNSRKRNSYLASETFLSRTIDVPRSFTMRSSFGRLKATVWGPFTSWCKYTLINVNKTLHLFCYQNTH